MRAVRPWRAGSKPSPELFETDAPSAGPGEVLLRVHATALNRADLLQLRGQYEPPAGESQIPGLEAAGEIVGIGAGVEGWAVGEPATALLAGGGHAELVAVPAGQLLPIPKGWGLEEAAALPEAALTSWTNLVAEGELRSGESVLVTAATSGVGTFAVQLARELGARVFAAGRDYERLEATRLFGASGLLLLDDTLPARVRAATDGVGADLCLDLVGGEHLNRALGALAPGGRLVLVGLMTGREATVDLSVVLRRGLRIVGSTLRTRPRAEKAELVAGFRRFATDLLDRRRLLPVIDSVYEFDEIAVAYRRLEEGRPFGKIVVRVGS